MRATAGRSNAQQNTTSNVNIRREHFSYFDTIGANPFRGFRTFREDNNNNNLPPLPLPPSGFERGLGEGFNPPLGGNARGLDLNIAVLVNTLAGVNLKINHVKRESNHVKLTEFRGTKAEDPNKWLEYYNRITEANKWSEHRKFHKRVPCGSSSKIVR